MKISRFQIRAVRVPMEPHRTASGTVMESPLVLTDVFTDDGIAGHSIVFTYTVAALTPTATMMQNLGELIVGQELAPVEIFDNFAKRFRLLGTQGITGMAIAGIDMALWDALARSRQTSLVRLLGGAEKPVPAYGAVGFDGAADSARVAEGWAKKGFRGVKAKVGYATAAEDLEVIRAIRKAIGCEMAIMVDYNQSLTPATAVERLRALEGDGLTWIEEPVLAQDYSGHAHVSREIKTPIQCGENWWGPRDMRQAIEAKASDFVMPDVMKIGGVTGWQRAAALADAHTIPVSNHLWPEISAQLMCVTPTAHFLEYADWWTPIVKEPLRVDAGMTNIQGVLGSGVEWNEAAVAKFAA